MEMIFDQTAKSLVIKEWEVEEPEVIEAISDNLIYYSYEYKSKVIKNQII